MNWFPSQMQVS